LDLNIRHFILLLFLLAFAAIFFLEPYHVSPVVKRGVPQVAFIDFESYEIKRDGVASHLKGSRAEKFQKTLRVEDAEMVHLAPRGEESVRAKEAIFVFDKRIELKEDVRLSRSDGWRLDTERLYYIIDKKLYTTRGSDFLITYGRSVVRGKNLFYYQKSGKIKAESIDAKIAEEDM
jgi:LPS export ABC transporter protein LptC